MELSIKNVRGLLYDAREKWYDIGIELEINDKELDIIHDKHDDPGKCLLEIIKIWLKSISPGPTWKTLADVLRGGIINEVALAKEGIN